MNKIHTLHWALSKSSKSHMKAFWGKENNSMNYILLITTAAA